MILFVRQRGRTPWDRLLICRNGGSTTLRLRQGPVEADLRRTHVPRMGKLSWRTRSPSRAGVPGPGVLRLVSVRRGCSWPKLFGCPRSNPEGHLLSWRYSATDLAHDDGTAWGEGGAAHRKNGAHVSGLRRRIGSRPGRALMIQRGDGAWDEAWKAVKPEWKVPRYVCWLFFLLGIGMADQKCKRAPKFEKSSSVACGGLTWTDGVVCSGGISGDFQWRLSLS